MSDEEHGFMHEKSNITISAVLSTHLNEWIERRSFVSVDFTDFRNVFNGVNYSNLLRELEIID